MAAILACVKELPFPEATSNWVIIMLHQVIGRKDNCSFGANQTTLLSWQSGRHSMNLRKCYIKCYYFNTMNHTCIDLIQSGPIENTLSLNKRLMFCRRHFPWQKWLFLFWFKFQFVPTQLSQRWFGYWLDNVQVRSPNSQQKSYTSQVRESVNSVFYKFKVTGMIQYKDKILPVWKI